MLLSTAIDLLQTQEDPVEIPKPSRKRKRSRIEPTTTPTLEIQEQNEAIEKKAKAERASKRPKLDPSRSYVVLRFENFEDEDMADITTQLKTHCELVNKKNPDLNSCVVHVPLDEIDWKLSKAQKAENRRKARKLHLESLSEEARAKLKQKTPEQIEKSRAYSKTPKVKERKDYCLKVRQGCVNELKQNYSPVYTEIRRKVEQKILEAQKKKD